MSTIHFADAEQNCPVSRFKNDAKSIQIEDSFAPNDRGLYRKIVICTL